jgi:hypothetical protein
MSHYRFILDVRIRLKVLVHECPALLLAFGAERS